MKDHPNPKHDAVSFCFHSRGMAAFIELYMYCIIVIFVVKVLLSISNVLNFPSSLTKFTIFKLLLLFPQKFSDMDLFST